MSLDLSWITRYLLRQAVGVKKGNQAAEVIAPIVNAVAPAFVPADIQTVLSAVNLPTDPIGVVALVNQGISLLPKLTDDQKGLVKVYVSNLILNQKGSPS